MSWGCGGDAVAEPAAVGGSTGGATAELGTGVLTLGGDRYAFRVLGCNNLESEFDASSDDYTLNGGGTREDGEGFYVYVTRSSEGPDVRHGVITTGDGFLRLASRARVQDRWVQGDAIGEVPNEPLVQVEGNIVRAEGTFFADMDPGTSPVTGSLVATCP